MLSPPEDVAAAIKAWRSRSQSEAAALFAREVVLAACPATPSHARSLLWCCCALGAFGELCGLLLEAEVMLRPSFVERFMDEQMAGRSTTRLRSVRTNLRFVARRVVPQLWPPDPLSLPRNRSKLPYSKAEMAAFCRLCDTQPTTARRMRLSALISLAAGAGLSGPDMRAITGRDVVRRSGGLVVLVRGRVAPVLVAYHGRLVRAAASAGDSFLLGGQKRSRKNVTSRLVASVAGGIDLPPLSLGRLRATWLKTQAESFSLAALFAAGGFRHSQYLGDIVEMCEPPSEEELVRLLGGGDAAG